MRLAKQQISYVDIDDIEVQLSSPEIPDSSVDELYRFGEILFSDVRQTSSQINTKLTSILGWSTATLAFLLFDAHSKNGNSQTVSSYGRCFSAGCNCLVHVGAKE